MGIGLAPLRVSHKRYAPPGSPGLFENEFFLGEVCSCLLGLWRCSWCFEDVERVVSSLFFSAMILGFLAFLDVTWRSM